MSRLRSGAVVWGLVLGLLGAGCAGDGEGQDGTSQPTTEDGTEPVVPGPGPDENATTGNQTPSSPARPEQPGTVPTPQAEAPVPTSAFCDGLADASCTMRSTCCQAGIDAAQCRTTVKNACLSGIAPDLTSTDWVYDGLQAFRCFEQMKALAPACETMSLPEPSACRRMLVRAGAKKSGESCAETGTRCEPGLVCWRDIAKLTAVCGPPLALGEDCDEDGDCVADAFCDDEGGFVCTAKKALGETCRGEFECTSGDCDLSTRKCVSPQAAFCAYTPQDS